MLDVTLIITTEAFNCLHPLKDAADTLITSRAAVNVTDVDDNVNILTY